jgi:hypothetical protein
MRHVLEGSKLHALAAALVVLTAAGCSLFRLSPQEEAAQVEPLLAAAGFRALPADTSEKLAHLQKLPPLKLTPRMHKGQLRYGYADPYSCNCLYVGDQQAYQEYQRLALQKNIADEQREAAMMNQDAAAEMQMDFWGPFGPWF